MAESYIGLNFANVCAAGVSASNIQDNGLAQAVSWDNTPEEQIRFHFGSGEFDVFSCPFVDLGGEISSDVDWNSAASYDKKMVIRKLELILYLIFNAGNRSGYFTGSRGIKGEGICV